MSLRLGNFAAVNAPKDRVVGLGAALLLLPSFFFDLELFFFEGADDTPFVFLFAVVFILVSGVTTFHFLVLEADDGVVAFFLADVAR